MKKTAISTAILLTLALNSYAQKTLNNGTEELLVVHSTQGRIEIKNSSKCTLQRTNNGSIAINCKSQCNQTTDSKDEKVLIQC